jgi:hypothetical protein
LFLRSLLQTIAARRKSKRPGFLRWFVFLLQTEERLQNMNAELRATLELARAVDATITFSERHHPSYQDQRAAARIREGVIGALRKACDELENQWPKTEKEEIARFTESIEKGQIPKKEWGPAYANPLRLSRARQGKAGAVTA